MSDLKAASGMVTNKLKVEIGQRFGRWVVVEDLGTIRDKGYWKSAVMVKCDCGEIRQHFLSVLYSGASTSCGCFRKENAARLVNSREHKHNLSKHPLYQIWRGMKCRCYNKKDKAYPGYGGRGIFVCKEWRSDFKAFYDWAMSNGWRKGLLNDRRDNDKEYSPQNCRFVTESVSMRNTRRNLNIEFNGVKKCITDWANDIGLKPQSIKKRLKLGWGIEATLMTPKTC